VYKGKTILMMLAALNEEGKVGHSVRRVPRDIVDEVLVVDDGSTDGTVDEARAAGAVVVSHEVNRGVGAAIRTAVKYAQDNGFDLVATLAGDDQDRPGELPRLAAAIVDDGADFVQGSRYMPGGERQNQPLSRTAMTRAYSVVFSMFVGRRVTDATNGFRLFTTAMTREVNLDQDWLDRYELEPYILWQAAKRFRLVEVPVTKYYPAKREVGYTKMKAYRDWWGISRPMLLLWLRLRK
jgi:dolichol-phosphate mannosyltransferase